jgi:hypothetical protein
MFAHAKWVRVSWPCWCRRRIADFQCVETLKLPFCFGNSQGVQPSRVKDLSHACTKAFIDTGINGSGGRLK